MNYTIIPELYFGNNISFNLYEQSFRHITNFRKNEDLYQKTMDKIIEKYGNNSIKIKNEAPYSLDGHTIKYTTGKSIWLDETKLSIGIFWKIFYEIKSE